MFTPRKVGHEQLIRYFKAKRKYLENVVKGKGTYREFARVVGMHLNLTMPAIGNRHRDHWIPKSFCRKLGLTPDQTNHPSNLRYLTPEQNIDKFSFIGEDERKHLKVMCEIWGIDYPHNTTIDKHNHEGHLKKGNLTSKKLKK